MARLALPLAGLAIGAAIPGIGASYGFLAGNLLGNLFPQTIRGPSIEEGAAQTTQEGAPRAIVYGTAMVAGNVIDAGKTRKVTTRQSQGKGGPTVESEGLLRTYAVRICEGPIGGILMAKKDGKVVYDIRPDADFDEDNQKFMDGCRIYLGGEDQLPDADLEAIRGVGEVPAHRGSAYIVFIDDDVTDRRGSIPQYEFVVSKGDVSETMLNASPIGQTLKGSHTSDGPEKNGTIYIPASEYEGRSSVLLFMRHLVPAWASNAAGVKLTISNGVDSLAYETFYTTSLNFPTRAGYTLIQVNQLDASSGIRVDFDVTDPPTNATPEMTYYLNIDVFIPGNTTLYSERAKTPIIPWTAGDFGIFTERDDPDAGYFYANDEWWGAPTFGSGGWSGDPDGEKLSVIVDDIHERCGCLPGSWDSSELTDGVDGLVFASAGYSGANAIDTLRAPYFFDATEWGGQLRYIKRGKPAVATITLDDLVEEPDDSQRQDQIEYPRKLHLTYQSAKVNYETAQATSERASPDVRVTGESAMQVPVVLTPARASEIAVILHKVSRTEAEGEVKFSLPDSWLRLVPSDCIALSLRGTSRRVRIDGIEMAGGIMQLTTNVDRQTAYASTTGYVPLPTPTPPVSSVVGSTVLAVLDVPALRDADDSLVYYAAAVGNRPAWRGADLQRSLDAGASYASVMSLDSPAAIGRLFGPMAAASPWYTDRTNMIEVELIRDGMVLDSITEAAFLARGGAVAVQSGGVWEVMQYRDAEHIDGRRYRLRTLHRGQLGTTPVAHAASALFVLLDDVLRVPAESAWLQALLTHRAPSFGGSQESAEPQTMTYAGNAQREWPVASLMASVDAGTLTASWAPRHRFGTDVAPLASLNFQGFRVSISDGATTLEFDTTDTEITRDVSGMSLPISITVSALNRITGPGPATTRTITT